MKLVIGGYAQGKLNSVLKNYQKEAYMVIDGELPENIEADEKIIIINHLHEWIKKCLAENGCPEEEILLFVEKNQNCILISDEIGNGIVPIDAFEREYRERTGRILIELAQKAKEVERVICGISQKIK